MKRLLILGAAAIALLSPGCSRNIDGLVRQHGCEAAYYYHSGGTQTDRFTTITVVMNKNGGILKREAGIHISNVQLIDPASNKPTRVGYRFEGGKKIRYAKKSGEEIK